MEKYTLIFDHLIKLKWIKQTSDNKEISFIMSIIGLLNCTNCGDRNLMGLYEKTDTSQKVV